MKKLMVWVLAVAAMLGGSLRAQEQDLTGNWQGTLHAGKDLRIIVNFYKGTKDGLSAKFYSIDQNPRPIEVTSVTRQGASVKVTVDLIGGSYEGKLSPDGKLITGTWTLGPQPMQLDLVRATPETAWEIPAPPPPPKLMAPDADPAFDVATIKPNPSAAASMQGLTMNGRNFRIRNGSLGDMIAFAYNVQTKQIVNAPDWLDKDRYDIDAVPDKEGAPSPQQVRVMMQKLLAERFALKFHKEKRDLAAYVLAVGKTGQKLTATQVNGPLPGYGIRPGAGGVTMNVVNSDMEDFTAFLQMLVLDKPVVDRTALTGHYDFKFTFTPDDSEFNGHPPKVPDTAGATETAPGLFEAMDQQVGLKLTPEKTAVDVIAIDHVEKPSPN